VSVLLAEADQTEEGESWSPIRSRTSSPGTARALPLSYAGYRRWSLGYATVSMPV